MHYNIWGLLCNVRATAKDKSKCVKKKLSVDSECICVHYIHIVFVLQVVGFMG
jgi:hypothetical protein